MAKRYFANIVTVSGKKIAFEIWNEDFAGEAKELEVSADTLTLTQSGEHLFDAVRATAGSIVVTSKTNFEFQDMMLEDDLANVVKIYEDGSLIFAGYIENGMYEEEYIAPPYDVQLCFTDGLKKLKGLYLDTDVLLNKMYYTLIELIRECLYPIMLPNKNGDKHLYINCSLHNDAFKNDINWGCFEQVFMHISALSGDSVAFYEVLEKILELFGATIFQYNGDWYIERIQNKLHNGTVSFVRYDLSKIFNAINNKGVAISKNRLIITVDEGERYITDTPKYTTEKEYKYQEIDVDTSTKKTLISNNFNLNKQLALECQYTTSGPGTQETWTYILKNGYSMEKYAPYYWYWPTEIPIPDQLAMPISVIKNSNLITNGVRFTHQVGHNIGSFIQSSTPCHVLFGSTINFKMKVHIDFKADKIDKKTYIMIPMRLCNVQYINTLDFPYKHNEDPYTAGAIAAENVVKNEIAWFWSLRVMRNKDTTATTPQQETPSNLGGFVCLCYNSEDDVEMFQKWYNGEAVEVSFSVNNTGWLSAGGIEKQICVDLQIYPAQFSNGKKMRPTNSNENIKSSSYGDIIVDINTVDQIESGYTVKTLDKKETYQIKREAPRISLRFWEGAPIYDSRYNENNALLSCYYTNFQLKNIILTPAFDDIYNKDENGNITGIKMIDDAAINITVANTRTVDKWYDKLKPIGDYNKKSLLVERLVQDRFNCYAKARRRVELTVHSEDIVFSMLYTYAVKHIQGAKLIATSITRNFDCDDYNITLEEIRDDAVKTTLFIPRNEIKKGVDVSIKTPIPGRDGWIM